jgi:hypothetical protein
MVGIRYIIVTDLEVIVSYVSYNLEREEENKLF